jgi:2,3-bisphosphoglycerate-independent phosphoglycerate mutase
MSKKAILLILDGVGMDKNKKGNAVVHAKTPILDSLVKHYPHTNLQASGEFVGLPKGQMGNSEVGHLNIGTGRIIYTGLSVINKSIEDKAFFENKSFVECAKHTKKFNSKLHLIGLVSNGGVHSSLEHLIELIKFCGKNKLNSVLHIITDGRDVGQKSFLDFYATLNPILLENNVKIGSIAGRFYAMDRDKN